MKEWYSTIRLNNDMEEISKEPLISDYCDYSYEGIKSNKAFHWIDLLLKPKSGFYFGFLISFKIIFPQKYPFMAPSIYACHNFLHPNLVISEAKVYSSFFQKWTPVNTFKTISEHLINLLFEVDDESIPDECINQTIRVLMNANPNLYKQIINYYYLNMKDAALNLIPAIPKIPIIPMIAKIPKIPNIPGISENPEISEISEIDSKQNNELISMEESLDNHNESIPSLDSIIVLKKKREKVVKEFKFMTDALKKLKIE